MRQSDRERRLRTIFDDAFRFSALLSPEGEVLEIERQALEFWGLADEDVRGRAFWEIGWQPVQEEPAGHLRAVVEAAAAGRPVRKEAAVWNTARQETPIVFSLRPLRDRAGNVVLLVAEVRNLNPRRQVEQHLRAEPTDRATAALRGLLGCLDELETPAWVMSRTLLSEGNAAALSLFGAESFEALANRPEALLRRLQPREAADAATMAVEDTPPIRALAGEAAVAELTIHDGGRQQDRSARCIAVPLATSEPSCAVALAWLAD